ncbi:MAG: M56 family metallopeptidase [Planctomycetota bacterium]
MSEFLPNLFWAAIQVSMLSAIIGILVLIVRRWIAGILCDMVTLSMVLLLFVTLLAFAPIPSWIPNVAAPNRSTPDHANQTASSENHDSGGPGSTEDFNSTLVDSPTSVPNVVWNERLSQFWTQLNSLPAVPSSEQSVDIDQAESGLGIRSLLSSASWVWILGSLIAISILIGCVRLWIGMLAIHGLRRRATEVHDANIQKQIGVIAESMQIRRPSTMRILETDEISTAATIGWLRPSILLPMHWRTWNDEERLTSITHELAHISTHDYLKNLIAQLAVAINYFNPIMHWLGRELRVAQELEADAKAASIQGGDSNYLMTMAEMALKEDTVPLGWLAQPFLPTRKTFIRRIEMLRGNQKLRGANSWAAIWLTRAALLGITLVCLGFRPPAIDQPVVAQESSRVSAPPTTATKPRASDKLNFVSDRASGFVSIDLDRVRELEFGRNLLNELTANSGIGVAEILEQSSLISIQTRNQQFGWVAFLKQPFTDQNQPLTAEGTFQYRGQKCFEHSREGCWHIPNPTTFVFSTDREFLKSMLDGKDGPLISTWPQSLKSELDRPVLIAVSQVGLEELNEVGLGGTPMERSLISPLLRNAKNATAAIGLSGNRLMVSATVMTEESKTERVEQTLMALKTLTSNLLDAETDWLGDLPDKERELLQELVNVSGDFVNKLEISSNGSAIRLKGSVKFEDDQLSALSTLMGIAKTRSSQASNRNNLRQLALSILNYEAAYRELPMVSMRREGSKFPHSWRVAILPFLDENELYEQYRFNEPWDSEHNQKVTSKMPDVFRHPSQPAGATQTHYLGFQGPGTVLGDAQPASFADIIDGTSNTILLVDSVKSVHWAKPEDIPVELGNMKSMLREYRDGEGICVLVDGSSPSLNLKKISEKTFGHLILRNDGNVVLLGNNP